MTLHSLLFALAGGGLIGLAASHLLLVNGRVAGVSGIAAGALVGGGPGERIWRLGFVAGLVLAGLAVVALRPDWLAAPTGGLGLTIAAGLLVGFGSRLGSGCTSGHGVCGISRMAPRSLGATVTFIATGAATATLVGMLRGGL